jgi:hypothetical protein
VTGIGDLGIGGIQAFTAMCDCSPGFTISSSYLLEWGDVGELRAGTQMVSIDPSAVSSATVRVLQGNLRSLDGGSIGRGTGLAPAASTTVDVPAGSVGLVRARTGVMFFNFSGTTAGRPPIGGDYQLIDAQVGSCYVETIANRGIGVIRAADMATAAPSIITANFDNTGEDGVIDLIDCVGDFGLLSTGGPWITTNTGGNLRYLRVGGNAFQDVVFGGGTPIQTTHLPGETVSLTDDSGATMNLVPMVQRTFTDPTTGAVTALPPDSLAIRTYGIRGSGGVAVIDVRANDSFTIDAGGNNPNATAEIGRIIINGGSVGSGVGLNLDQGGPVFPNTNFFVGSDNPGFGGDIPAPAGSDERLNPYRLVGSTANVGGTSINDPGGARGDLDVIVGGVNRVDIWDIVAIDTAVNTDSHLTSIQNNSPNGEIVNVRAASVGTIVANGSIGLARSRVVPGMQLNPLRFYEDLGGSGDSPFPGNPGTATNQGPVYGLYYGNNLGQFPYIDQRVGVWITGDMDENGTATLADPNTPGSVSTPAISGDVISIRTGGGIGNIVVNGSIGELLAGNGPADDPVKSGGIQGIVWARGHADPVPAQTTAIDDPGGDIWYIDVGSGLAASGSGSAIRAGIYAARHIDRVVANNADLRGNIVAGDGFEGPRNRIPVTNQLLNQFPDLGGDPNGIRPQFVPNVLDFPDSIRSIEVRNGSIINANIAVLTDPMMAIEQPAPTVLTPGTSPISNPEFLIGRVTTTGKGGIIGTSFVAADIGLIDVNDGFGIFTSQISTSGTGVLGGIEADNYGIRDVIASLGGSMQFLNARGDGGSVSTASFSPSVRRSELGYTGTNADPLTGFPQNVLTDIHAVLGTSAAQPELPGHTDTGVIEDVDIRGQRDMGNIRAQQIRASFPDQAPSIINFANSIGSLIVRDQINGLNMTTGRLNNFKPAGDVFNLDLTVAGPLKNLLIQGDLADGSVIRTQGRVGNMGDIKILGSLDGDILSSGKIKRLFVGQSVSGNVSARRGKGNAIGSLIIGGDISEGGFSIQGNMGKIVIESDFGRTGTDFTVTGKLGSLTVKGNLYSNVHVGSVLNKLTVGGSIITGVLVEAQQIKRVVVGQDVQPGVIFRSKKAPKITTGGQMLGQVQLT